MKTFRKQKDLSTQATEIHLSTFRTCILIGAVPFDVIPLEIDNIMDGSEWPFPTSEDSSVDARELLRQTASFDKSIALPCLILTTLDLHIGGRVGVFGYADPALQAAVVSVSRLGHNAPDGLLKARVRNECAHELGHVKGLAHCERNCVMRQVRTAAELDFRPFNVCGHCPQNPIGHLVQKCILVAATICCAVFLSDFILSRALPAFDTPFTCWCVDACGRPSVNAKGSHDEAAIYFEHRKLFTLFGQDGRNSLRDRSLPAVEALNTLANDHTQKHLVVWRTGITRWGIGVAGSRALLEVLPSDVHGTDTAEHTATVWAQILNSSFEEYSHAKHN